MPEKITSLCLAGACNRGICYLGCIKKLEEIILPGSSISSICNKLIGNPVEIKSRLNEKSNLLKATLSAYQLDAEKLTTQLSNETSSHAVLSEKLENLNKFSNTIQAIQ